jgi:NET1-associated nuclear protein 1 (U3 small nucleolar RNA-associated protein 17)
VRSLFVSLVDTVTSCITSPSDPEQVLVSTYTGAIVKYNWVTGRKLQKWKTNSGLIRIYGLSAGNPGDNGDIIIAINHRPGGARDLLRLNLPVSPKIQMKTVVLRSQQRMATTIVTLEDGKLIAGFGGDRVMLGSSKDSVSGEYAWHDFSVSGKIVSLDARIRDASITTHKARSIVDVVVGLQDGSIRIVDDILTRLTQLEKAAKDIDRISRRLHWHREAVSAVKWSRDGASRIHAFCSLFP